MPYPCSEEHTSELQSHDNLVCRLLLEKKHVHLDRKSTRLNSSHTIKSYAVFCLKKTKVAGLQHRLDVAGAAPLHLGIPDGVLHDPFVDRAALLQIGARFFFF